MADTVSLQDEEVKDWPDELDEFTCYFDHAEDMIRPLLGSSVKASIAPQVSVLSGASVTKHGTRKGQVVAETDSMVHEARSQTSHESSQPSSTTGAVRGENAHRKAHATDDANGSPVARDNRDDDDITDHKSKHSIYCNTYKVAAVRSFRRGAGQSLHPRPVSRVGVAGEALHNSSRPSLRRRRRRPHRERTAHLPILKHMSEKKETSHKKNNSTSNNNNSKRDEEEKHCSSCCCSSSSSSDVSVVSNTWADCSPPRMDARNGKHSEEQQRLHHNHQSSSSQRHHAQRPPAACNAVYEIDDELRRLIAAYYRGELTTLLQQQKQQQQQQQQQQQLQQHAHALSASSGSSPALLVGLSQPGRQTSRTITPVAAGSNVSRPGEQEELPARLKAVQAPAPPDSVHNSGCRSRGAVGSHEMRKEYSNAQGTYTATTRVLLSRSSSDLTLGSSVTLPFDSTHAEPWSVTQTSLSHESCIHPPQHEQEQRVGYCCSDRGHKDNSDNSALDCRRSTSSAVAKSAAQAPTELPSGHHIVHNGVCTDETSPARLGVLTKSHGLHTHPHRHYRTFPSYASCADTVEDDEARARHGDRAMRGHVHSVDASSHNGSHLRHRHSNEASNQRQHGNRYATLAAAARGGYGVVRSVSTNGSVASSSPGDGGAVAGAGAAAAVAGGGMINFINSLPSYSSTSFVRAYVSDVNVSFEPAVFVSGLAAVLNIVFVRFIQNHVLDTHDQLSLFLIGSYLIFTSYFTAYYFLERFSDSFRRISSLDKKFYIIGNLIKAGTLFSITPFALYHLFKILVWNSWENNTLHNLGCIYTMPDFIAMMVVTRMRWSTWLHHFCVVLFNYFSIMNDYNDENVCRCLVVYAAFSTFGYCVNVLLASRFFSLAPRMTRVLSWVALVTFALCCAINWSWQAYYIQSLLRRGLGHWTVYLYVCLISMVIWDDVVLNKWLLNHARGNAFVANYQTR